MNIDNLVKTISQLPGIGPRLARKITFFLMLNPDLSQKLVDDVHECQKKVLLCAKCNNLDTTNPCSICSAERGNTICIVRNHIDMNAIELTQCYKGFYLIIGNSTSPSSNNMESILEQLTSRIQGINCSEIIMSLNPSVENRIMSEYIGIRIKDFNIKVTSIVTGIPMGGNLEYMDPDTISSSISGRSKI